MNERPRSRGRGGCARTSSRRPTTAFRRDYEGSPRLLAYALAARVADAAGLKWVAQPNAVRSQPPYELRPGTGRTGPADFWERFDRAVADYNEAIAASSAGAVADAADALADAAERIAVAHDQAAAQPGAGAAGQPASG
jgi:hypothetical protein